MDKKNEPAGGRRVSTGGLRSSAHFNRSLTPDREPSNERRFSFGSNPNSPAQSSRHKMKPTVAFSSSTDRGFTRRRTMTAASADGRVIAGPDLRGSDEMRLDLRAQMIRSLNSDLVYLHSKLEYVYLRDNKLTSLDGVEVLKRVKVLDLSFNSLKDASLQPLSNCKALQQLYLAGNRLTTIESLPKLNRLEFLTVAQNSLRSLAMANQPLLQALIASRNKILTLDNFPHLPALEHLHLGENPFSDDFYAELTAVILVGPSLTKFNDKDISSSTYETAKMYPGHTAMCIRSGWKVVHMQEATASMARFLSSLWSDVLPPGYSIMEASLDGCQEEDPCSCELSFQQHGSKMATMMRYQWHRSQYAHMEFIPIEGATKQAYWPRYLDVGYFLKVDCFPIFEGHEYGPVSLVSPPVQPGTGLPRVLSIEIVGDAMEGSSLKAVYDVAWANRGSGKSQISWWRCFDSKEPEVILDAEGSEYTATLADVGARLVFVLIPVSQSGVKGESQRASTDHIRAAPPSVSEVQFNGECVQGSVLKASSKYFGGLEGNSLHEWFRESSSSQKLVLVSSGSSQFTLTEEDVGHKIIYRFTPINSNGMMGKPVSISSSTIEPPPPKVTEAKILGDLIEGSTVNVSTNFNPGRFGSAIVQWFRSRSTSVALTSEMSPLSPANNESKELEIPLQAVGFYLLVRFTPKRLDGVMGKPVTAVSSSVVQSLPPSASSLQISGDLIEGHTLNASYVYRGGYEGKKNYGWYRHDAMDDHGVPIKESICVLRYTLRKEDVGKFISFKCFPTRFDGVQGTPQTIFSSTRILPGPPKIVSLRMLGEVQEGEELKVVKEYKGGVEGKSSLQWYLKRPNGNKEKIENATGDVYVVRGEDLDACIFVVCTPERIDGVKGNIFTSSLTTPVTAPVPRCDGLKFIGEFMEGSTLTFDALYRGGQKGHCISRWYRQFSKDSELLISEKESLSLSYADCGLRIRLEFVPVRSDGVHGSPVSILSGLVAEGEPVGLDLGLPEPFLEGREVVPRRAYVGGTEGEGIWEWYRSPHRPNKDVDVSQLEMIANSWTYIPELNDVGSFLVLKWIPMRADGESGNQKIATATAPVLAGPPTGKQVWITKSEYGSFIGHGLYSGGQEGNSEFHWYRENSNGLMTRIPNAEENEYIPVHDDYGCKLIFGYVPHRMDGVIGSQVLSEPSDVVFPDLPSEHGISIEGNALEGETLRAEEQVEEPWSKFRKQTYFQWWRSKYGDMESFFPIAGEESSSYEIKLEDVSCYLRCTCTMADIFGRTTSSIQCDTQMVSPSHPRISDLEIEGRGYHTSLFVVKGNYKGGHEGASSIQWFRITPPSTNPIPIPGEIGKTYEASADDVDCRLMVKYIPVREDGVEGQSMCAETDTIQIEKDVARDVKQIVTLKSATFETQHPDNPNVEKRVVDVNNKRLKILRPRTFTSFYATELKAKYDPPFSVELKRNEPLKLRIVMNSDMEMELMVHSRHTRDVIALAVRKLVQIYRKEAV